jgi:hypothetical protein
VVAQFDGKPNNGQAQGLPQQACPNGLPLRMENNSWIKPQLNMILPDITGTLFD